MAIEAGARRFNSPIIAPAIQHKGVRTLITTTTATRGDNSGKTNLLSLAAGFTVTLPAALGTGRRFRFVVGVTLTSGTYVVKVANGTDVFVGGVFINDIGDTTAATADYFPTAASSDTYTMTQTIGGGKIGDWVEFEDIKSGFWFINGVQQGVTDPTTPFSATVS